MSDRDISADDPRFNDDEYVLDNGYLMEASNMDGDVFAIPTIKTIVRNPGVVVERDSSICKWCNDKWINKRTRFCAWHQEHHEMRCMVYSGEISEEEYEKWISGHRVTLRGNPKPNP